MNPISDLLATDISLTTTGVSRGPKIETGSDEFGRTFTGLSVPESLIEGARADRPLPSERVEGTKSENEGFEEREAAVEGGNQQDSVQRASSEKAASSSDEPNSEISLTKKEKFTLSMVSAGNKMLATSAVQNLDTQATKMLGSDLLATISADAVNHKPNVPADADLTVLANIERTLAPIVRSPESSAFRGSSVGSLTLAAKEPQVFASNMATHLRVIKSQGGGEAKFNLHPAELGRMSVSLVTEGSETKISFAVETSQARQAIESSLPKLRDMLEQSGLTLSESDVSERGSESPEDDLDPHAKNQIDASDTDGATDSALSITVRLDPNHLLDVFA